MKKFIGAFCLCLVAGMSAAAAAYDSPNASCYAKDGEFDFIIYFENAIPREGQTSMSALPNMPAGCVEKLTKELNSIKLNKDTRILLLATTDKRASWAYNDKLSKRRLDIVKSLFDNAHQGSLITWTGGETEDNNSHPNENRNPSQRAVRVFVRGQTVINNIVNNVQVVQTSQSTAMQHNVTVNISMGDGVGSPKRVRALVSDIKNSLGAEGLSVWKNKEGNFNTSRLASDSIAGVVLGTVGGLITSNVIKKNQLKSGFGDIKCVIGGQIVADYRDDFVVGIR